MTLIQFIERLYALGYEHGFEHKVIVGSDCCAGDSNVIRFVPPEPWADPQDGCSGEFPAMYVVGYPDRVWK